ncbi:MAG: hypothetical protein IPL09_07780 [Bacteroidetes bacterium]|nr:hypothetical protein [Bacteroidota bacterium]
MTERKGKVAEFSNNIFVSQFYYFLFNGVYSSDILKDYIEIEEAGIFRLEILKAYPNDSSDIILDLNERLIKIKNYFIENAHFKQKCSEDDLINFWKDYCISQKILRVEGIRLYELSKLFDITEYLKNGYFLQDVFFGYQS